MTFQSNTPRTRNTHSAALLEQAHSLVEAHNASVNPTGAPFCEDGRPGYFVIDITGAKHVYFTLYRFNNRVLPTVNPYQYCGNLSTDLLKAVEKVCTHRGLPVILNEDENFNPKLGGIPVLGFGKHKGLTIEAVYETAPNYVMWIANKFEARNKQGRALKASAEAFKEAHYQMITVQNQESCPSRFQGALKDRADLTLTVYHVTPGQTDQYGSYSKPKYKAVDENGNLFYFWSKLELGKDDIITIKATVVAHRELLGKQFTRLNRVKALNVISAPTEEIFHDEPDYSEDRNDYDSGMSHTQQCYADRRDYAQEQLRAGRICPIQAAEIAMGA